MTYLQQVNEWSHKHQRNWFVVLRIFLGLSLFLKGIQFLKETEILEELIARSAVTGNSTWLNTFIPWLHLFGGMMILMGLFTRISVLFQLPILLGAVFFTNTVQEIVPGRSELFFSVTILLLLLFFLVEGSGPLSLDKAWRSERS